MCTCGKNINFASWKRSSTAIIRNMIRAIFVCATMSVATATMAESPCSPEGVRLRMPRSIQAYGRTPRQLQLFNDINRHELSVDAAHDGVARGNEIIPFTGKGVVIGVVDVGIDPRHVAFRDPSTGNSRVALYVTTSSSAETATGRFTYKAYELMDGQTIEKRLIDFAGDGHGTHTAGTAAGSDVGNPYYGMAPDATLVLTSMGKSIYEDEMMFGITTAMDYAEEHGMPCVASLSIGGTSGMHDGTGMVTDVLSQELAPTGQIVCFAAGNDGQNTSSLQRDFTADPDPLATIFYKGPYGSKSEFIDTYLTSKGKDLRVAFTLVHMTPEYCEEVWRSDYFNAFDMPADGQDMLPELDALRSHTKEDAYLRLSYIQGIEGNNGLKIEGHLPWIQEPQSYTLGLVFHSPGGEMVYGFTNYMSSAFGSFATPGYTRGNAEESISDHCTSPCVISVGATNMRISYTDLDGNEHAADPGYGEIGATGLYSSYGSVPEKLPHTMAPGTEVISALNERSNYTKVASHTDCDGLEWFYGASSGTSMSTPSIAGMIALWLQADPALSREDVLDLLDRTGNRTVGGDRSQFGTPSAYEGLKLILERQSSLIQPGMDSLSGQSPNHLMVRYQEGDEAEIVVPFPCTGGEYVLVSQDGRVCETASFKGNTFSINIGKGAGVYILNVHTPQGGAVQKILSRP